MIPTKYWLEPYPWEVVVFLNKQACEAGKVEHQFKPERYETAQKLWKKTRASQQTMRKAIEICRECHRLSPFQFFNGNTFASIARSLIQDTSKSLGITKSHIFRSAVGHYVAGTLEAVEFDNIYQSVTKSLKTPSPKKQE